MKKKILAMFSVAMLAVGMFSTSALASTTKNWTVNYAPGAPSGSANPVQYVYFTNVETEFSAGCNTFSGPSGKKVTITADIGLSRSVTFGYAGDSYSFSSNANSGKINFKVALSASSNSSATGYITAKS